MPIREDQYRRAERLRTVIAALPYLLPLSILLVLATAIMLFVIGGYTYKWEWTGFMGKRLWDWMELLLVPVLLALGGFLITQMERVTAARAQRLQQINIAERSYVDREIAEERRQDDQLQTYLGQMSHLLTDTELRSKTHWLDDVRVTARAQTLAVLSQLGGERKGSVLQFLYEAQLINRWTRTLEGEETQELGPDGPAQFVARIVGLSGADLRNADLRYLTLESAALDGAILENADLRGARLSNSDLGGAYLSGADLSDADLRDASLVNAQLQRKDELNVSAANLSGADLSGADLSGADLSRAILSRAILDRVHLSRANLSGADLSNTNLSLELIEERLEQAKSLDGATMPDGQVLKGPENPNGPTFTEWRKRLEDNFGP